MYPVYLSNTIGQRGCSKVTHRKREKAFLLLLFPGRDCGELASFLLQIFDRIYKGN